MRLGATKTKSEFKSFWRNGGLKNIKIADPDLELNQRPLNCTPERMLWKAVLVQLIEDLFADCDTKENYNATRYVLNNKHRESLIYMLESALTSEESENKVRRILYKRAKENEAIHNKNDLDLI